MPKASMSIMTSRACHNLKPRTLLMTSYGGGAAPAGDPGTAPQRHRLEADDDPGRAGQATQGPVRGALTPAGTGTAPSARS